MSLNIPRTEEICRNRRELAASPAFLSFLRGYNARMRLKDKKWKDISSYVALKDYETAKKLYEYWRVLEVSGRVKAITAIQANVKRMFLEIKQEDRQRALPPHEIEERFGLLGIDIQKTVRDSAFHYELAGFEKVLRKRSILKQGEQYSLQMPVLTEEKMENIENSLKEGPERLVMIDDPRIATLEIFDLYAKKGNHGNIMTDRNLVRESIPLPSRQPGIIVFNPILDDAAAHIGSESFNEECKPLKIDGFLRKNRNSQNFPPGCWPVDLATYLKISGFVRKFYPETAKNMFSPGLKTKHPTVILANMFMDGRRLAITGDYAEGNAEITALPMDAPWTGQVEMPALII